MNTSLKARLLQHFINKKKEGGFTLIELLVVIIIIGILAAIALPSFLNQANRAKEAEANTNVGSVNRAQQAFRLENDTFADRLDKLDVGIDDDTDYYNYKVDDAVPVTATRADVIATPKDETLKGFRGCATADKDGKTTVKVLKGAAGNEVPDPAGCTAN
ncbi:MAG: type IV pilin-like G/H family protein [Leptolyngbyaceae cyanobacterium T60_A2020_046]|nr:type IV pilin-like G/H family protein [Leptolyngbyaceae cyanobacterium T60_A2020_046]